MGSITLPDPRQWSTCQTGHCFVREGRHTRTSELLRTAFTLVDLVLKISFSSEPGIIKGCTGKHISALSDPFSTRHVKNKSGHTLKHCQEQQYFMGLHIMARPSGQKINTLQVRTVKKETSMKCCRHRPTIFKRKECNGRRRRSIPLIFPLEIRGSVSGRHFRIRRQHHPSSFSFLHTKKIVADWQLTLQKSTVEREV